MYSTYTTREERKDYEKSRRDKVMRESLDHRLMRGWLKRVQPDMLAQFYAFKEGIRRLNPTVKDLTRTAKFRQFVREGGDARPRTMTVPKIQ